LVAGELALNTNDGKLYYKDSSGVVQVLATKAGSSGSFGALTATSITDSGLTSGRVTYATTGGLLTDSANLTFSSTVTSIGITPSTWNLAGYYAAEIGVAGNAIFSGLGDTILSSNAYYNSGWKYAASSVASSLFELNGTNAYLKIANAGTVGGAITWITPMKVDISTYSGYSLLTLDNPTNGSIIDFNINGTRTGSIFTDSTGLNLQTRTAIPTIFSTNATERMRIDSNGLVGIGLTPSGSTVKLQVSTDALISGLTVGKGGGSVVGSSVFGTNAGISNTTGGITAIGYQAGYSNTTGTGNSILGINTFYANTTGSSNVAIGDNALRYNTTAYNNTAVGYQAGYSNTTGPNNFFGGYQAGYSNTTGNLNAFVGYQSGYFNTTGTYNVGLGYGAYGANTTAATGSYNTAVGPLALYNNTTASNNTAVGYQAGYTNSTGVANTFIGNQAGYTSNVNGTGVNCCVGNAAGYSLTTGTNNTFIGGSASGYFVTTGSKNAILGHYNGNQGGLDIRTASNYIVLSDGDGNPRQVIDSSGSLLVGTTNFTAGAKGFVVRNDNAGGTYTQIGATGTSAFSVAYFYNTNGNVGHIDVSGSSTSYVTSSDYRLKENIAPMTGALATVAQLKPVTYKWKVDGSDGQGFIAHELQAVVPDCVTGEKDAVDADGKPIYQGIDTSFLVATLTAAIQELKAEFDAYKATHP
jgi:hypothetical protein